MWGIRPGRWPFDKGEGVVKRSFSCGRAPRPYRPLLAIGWVNADQIHPLSPNPGQYSPALAGR
jgi:hypothetical protein